MAAWEGNLRNNRLDAEHPQLLTPLIGEIEVEERTTKAVPQHHFEVSHYTSQSNGNHETPQSVTSI